MRASSNTSPTGRLARTCWPRPAPRSKPGRLTPWRSGWHAIRPCVVSSRVDEPRLQVPSSRVPAISLKESEPTPETERAARRARRFPCRRGLLAPGRALPDPAVFAELVVKLQGQWPLVAGGDIGFHIFEFAHAGDDGGDIVIVKDEAEGHFGHGGAGRNQWLQRVSVFDARAEILGN